jgi:hypothetical protein
MLVFGSVMHTEKHDEKNRIYGFLDTLPITTTQIVAAKYLLILLLDIAGIGFLYLAMKLFAIRIQPAGLPLAALVLGGNVSLVLCGLGYVGVFKWGYSRLRVVIMVMYIALLVVPQLLLFLFIESRGSLSNIVSTVTRLNLPLVSAGGFLLFFATMLYALRVKGRKT